MRDREAERADFLSRANPDRAVPVARILPADTLTPVLLFQRMRDSGEECFLLESVEGGETIARYTFLGCGPDARLTITDRTIEEERAGARKVLEGDPLRALERLTVRPRFAPDADLPPLSSGAVGFLSYDAVRLFEEIPGRHPREGAIPDGLFLLFDAVVAFDHPRQRLLLLTTLEAKAGEEREEVIRAIARLDRLEGFVSGTKMAKRPLQISPLAPDGRVSAIRDDWRKAAGNAKASAPGDEEGMTAPGFTSLVPKDDFLAAVERGKEAIFAGDVYQVVLSQRWTGPLDLDPFDVYRALRTLNPSPYLFYLETREAAIFGASPEMLVRCRGAVVETRPIAGTARRGGTREEDRDLAESLLADPKERAEHVMLVDLARNDLGRVCQIGSVEVARYAVIEKYSHVQHIVSEVRGRLAGGKTALDALAACFPAGTLTGAPKIRAMELIDALEGARRGVYGGVVGYLDAGGNLDVAIAIRMAVVEKGICRIQAGAGIVADSVAEKEYLEAQSKAAALFRAIDLARERLESAS